VVFLIAKPYDFFFSRTVGDIEQNFVWRCPHSLGSSDHLIDGSGFRERWNLHLVFLTTFLHVDLISCMSGALLRSLVEIYAYLRGFIGTASP